MSAVRPSACAGAVVLLSSLLPIAASAADPVASPAVQVNMTAARKILAEQHALSAASGAKTAISASGGSKAGEYYANVSRSYPPSCLNSPLPLGLWQNDPNALQTTLALPGDPVSGDANERAYSETVTITLFRVACSGGKSASLLEIDRPAGASTTYYPVMPQVTISQGSVGAYTIRLADDPNTFFATTYALTPLFSSDVFVLENYYNPGTANPVDYNQAFTLDVDNLVLNDANGVARFNVNAYAAPANPAPMPLSGYLSSAYYDPAHSGEGLEVEIYDNGDSTTRTFFAAWYTYDPLGLPFWLTAQASFPITDTSGNLTNSLVNVPTFYVTNGGFAGNFGPKATTNNWGTMSFSFPDCNHVTFSYNGNTGTVNGPGGSGSKTWQRLATINSLTCQ
ncbi:MAG TPA: hypothetical protein VF132_13085 [Rudaea sp.]